LHVKAHRLNRRAWKAKEGHETTANALSWTWHLLSEHPDVAAKLRAEAAQVLGGRLPTIEDVPRLAYTRMVLDESMRLYPRHPAAARRHSDEAAQGRRCGFDLVLRFATTVAYRARVPSPGWEKVRMRGIKRLAKPSASVRAAVVACGVFQPPSP